jgi:hypothetical protein
MKTHVDIAHPRLFALRKTQLAKKAKLLMQIILDKKGRKGLGLLVLQSHLFWVHKPMQNNDEAHQMFIKDLVLYICKRFHVLSITKDIWLKRLVLH